MENERFTNTRDLDTYLRGEGLGKGVGALWTDDAITKTTAETKNMARMDVSREHIILDRQAQMEEFLFLGLRMLEGVSRAEFKDCFGVEIEAVYGTALDRLCRQGLLRRQEGFLSLTKEGISVSNYVMSEFLR